MSARIQNSLSIRRGSRRTLELHTGPTEQQRGFVAIVLLLAPWVRGLLLAASGKPDKSPGDFSHVSLPPTSTFSQSFLDNLHREGLRVGVGQSDQEAIKLGRAVCQQLDNGQSEQQQEQLAVQLAARAGLST
jgi:hypothetical protein